MVSSGYQECHYGWEMLEDALTEVMEPIEILSYSPEEFELEVINRLDFKIIFYD